MERNGKSLGELQIMSIENPTLAHFRHFSHFRHLKNFSSLFTHFPSTTVENSLQINPFYAKQTQFSPFFTQNRGSHEKTNPIQTQFNPIQTQFNPKQTQFKAKQSQFLVFKSVVCSLESAVFSLKPDILLDIILINRYNVLIKQHL